jgi:predicted Fe-Mo cluster-binding NifX family protein
MKIAIPMDQGKLTPHFGHCEVFAIIEVENNVIISSTLLTPPPHEPGVLPAWICNEVKADLIIAGGLGKKARDILEAGGTQVILGAPTEFPEVLVNAYLSGTLEGGQNSCDH